jgi:hypothetical protein
MALEQLAQLAPQLFAHVIGLTPSGELSIRGGEQRAAGIGEQRTDRGR